MNLSRPPLLRRARPLLGTLVEVGVAADAQLTLAGAAQAVDDAFAALARVHAALTRFDAGSDIARFNAAAAGAVLAVGADAQAVLQASAQLQALSDGAFDITLGSGPADWQLCGALLHKRSGGVRIDLGGIGKGHAVDAAVQALQTAGCAAGWVNAGGDLRSFGGSGLRLQLRDEASGGVRPWGQLQDGACATSHYAPGSRSALAQRAPSGQTGPQRPSARGPLHLSVLAPSCLWADALTKVAAQHPQQLQHPALQALGAQAVWH